MTLGEIFLNIFTSIVGNLLTLLFVLLATVVCIFISRCLFFKKRGHLENLIVSDQQLQNFLQHDTPHFQIQYTKDSAFHNILPSWIVGFLASYYDKLTGSNSYNGKCIRLDNYDINEHSITIDLSTVKFFDLLSTNITFFPGNVRYSNVWKWFSLLPDTIRYYSILSDWTKRIVPKIPSSLADILKNNHLANVLAVSVNIYDSSGNTIVAKRVSNLTISGNIYSVAATGTVTERDTIPVSDNDTSNVLQRAAARELEEEVGVIVDPQNIKVVDIIATKQKFQPIAVTEVLVENAAAVVKPVEEISDLYILNVGDLNTLFAVLTRFEFSPASAYSLLMTAAKANSLSEKDILKLYRKHGKKLNNYKLAREWKNRSKVITTL